MFKNIDGLVNFMFKHRYSIKNGFSLNSGLYLVQCGTDDCLPEQNYGPIFRDHNLIHFVFEGEGFVEMEGKTYKINPGNAFLIKTGVYCKTIASATNPWSYRWIGFDGVDASKIFSFLGIDENPIFNFTESTKLADCFDSLIEAYGNDGNNFAALGKMYEIFSHIIPIKDNTNHKNNTLNSAIEYIEKNYMKEITVEDISSALNISRSQLYRTFVQNVGLSPNKYLVTHRISRAAELLRITDLSISEISSRCGFNDTSYFYQQFKKVYQRSPIKFRKYIRENSAFWDAENSPQ